MRIAHRDVSPNNALAAKLVDGSVLWSLIDFAMSCKAGKAGYEHTLFRLLACCLGCALWQILSVPSHCDPSHTPHPEKINRILSPSQFVG